MVAIPLLFSSIFPDDNPNGGSITNGSGESTNVSLESSLDHDIIGSDNDMDMTGENHDNYENEDGNILVGADFIGGSGGDNDQLMENDILKLEVLKPASSPSTSSSNPNPNSTCNKCGQQQQKQLMPSVYKDVVVIGNGPSGIALSYFLAGNWPYYNGCGESVNEMLHYRLLAALEKKKAFAQDEGENKGKQQDDRRGSSIVEQDLHFLAQVRK